MDSDSNVKNEKFLLAPLSISLSSLFFVKNVSGQSQILKSRREKIIGTNVMTGSWLYPSRRGGKYLFLLIHLLEEIEQQRYKGNCGVFDYDTGSSIGK